MTSPRIVVKFSDVGEWVEELAAYPPNVQDCVRYTALYRAGGGPLPFRQSFAVATYLRNDGPILIVELMQYTGDFWPGLPPAQEPNAASFARLKEIESRVTEAAGLQGLQTCSGIYTAEQFERNKQPG